MDNATPGTAAEYHMQAVVSALKIALSMAIIIDTKLRLEWDRNFSSPR